MVIHSSSLTLRIYLFVGKKNTIAVQVKNEGSNSRWYSGSGLYRHVWLNVTNPLYIPTNGTYIVSSQVSDKSAKVTIETILKNDYDTDKEITLETTILNCHGEMIDKYTTPSSLSSYDNQKVEQTFWLKEPKLWSPDSPSLYTARTRVLSDGKIEDLYETTFGVRTISFDAQKGFPNQLLMASSFRFLQKTDCKQKRRYAYNPIG